MKNGGQLSLMKLGLTAKAFYKLGWAQAIDNIQQGNFTGALADIDTAFNVNNVAEVEKFGIGIQVLRNTFGPISLPKLGKRQLTIN